MNGLEAGDRPRHGSAARPFQLTHVRLGDRPEFDRRGVRPHRGADESVDVRIDKAPKVTDAGVEHLRNLPRLESLWLDGTGITDDGLAHLKGLRTLKELGLRGTSVTDTGARTFPGPDAAQATGPGGVARVRTLDWFTCRL